MEGAKAIGQEQAALLESNALGIVSAVRRELPRVQEGAQKAAPPPRKRKRATSRKRGPTRVPTRGLDLSDTPDPALWKFPVKRSRGLLTMVYCQNIVSTINICSVPGNRRFDKDLMRLIGAKCNLDQFHAISWRVMPGCTILLFATGKVVVSGSKSIEDMNCGSLTAVSILNGMRIGNFSVTDRKITNIVGTTYLPPGHKLHFDAIHRAIPLQCTITSTFAGLFVRMPTFSTNFILFQSGAIVICGRSIELITAAVVSLEDIILRSNAMRVVQGVQSKLVGLFHGATTETATSAPTSTSTTKH